ncbi:glycosyltransferase family 2 protein [Roseateles koreensis]|uniref:Glycosyltransferase n=1 Tax=Roseateles koreensis TaxID=2987526 RepID=A0ABT5KT93_9BURK|nr:glycosyltransferase [Roseateles koreensis]
MPKVSVIIPAFNAARYLGETMASVLNSSFHDLELIVVDDGSKDETAQVAQSFVDNRVCVIRQSNRGMSASRNAGIAAATGQYIALLDADDVWHPDKLKLQVTLLDSQPEIGVCFTEFQIWHGSPIPDFSSQETSEKIEASLTGWIYPKMILTHFALPSTIVFRRSVWDALGPFLCENHQTDDWEYFVRASRAFRFAKLSDRLVLYRQHQGSLSKRPSPLNSTEAMRTRLLQQYGMTCPNGGPVDAVALAQRQYLGLRHFADGHLAHGDFALGLRSFGQLLRHSPQRFSTLLTLLKSIRQRIRRSF